MGFVFFIDFLKAKCLNGDYIRTFDEDGTVINLPWDHATYGF